MKNRPKFDITKTNYPDNPCWLFKKVIDPFTPPLARFVYNLGFSANAVSVISFIIGMSGIAAMLILNNYLGLVIAAILITIRTLGDAIDGKIARATGTAAPLGSFLDIIVDWLFFHAAFFITIGFLTGHIVIGFLCVTGYMSREFARTKFTQKYGAKITETSGAKKVSRIVSIVKKYDIAAVTLLAPILLLLNQPVWIIYFVVVMEYSLLFGELFFDFIALGRISNQAKKQHGKNTHST